MKYVDSHRRQIVMAVLLLLGLIGAGVRYMSAETSTAHDVGTLLMVLWIPAVGNLITFLVKKKRGQQLPRMPGFASDAVYDGHLVVRLVADPAFADAVALLPPDLANCTVIVGQQGFTARAAAPLAGLLADGECTVSLQMLRPEVALKHLPVGTSFICLGASKAVARGTVESAGADA